MKRRFTLGDEWLYIKLYAGITIQERLLSGELYDLTLMLYEKKIIDKFFFVRYADEQGDHLRLRFHLIELTAIGYLVKQLNESLGKYIESRLIYKLSTDSYHREIERYGADYIIDAESIFSQNSMKIMYGLREMIRNEREDDRLIWGAKIMDRILTDLGLSFAQKHLIYERYYKLYESEFNINTFQKQKLSLKHRMYNRRIEEAICADTDEQSSLPLGISTHFQSETILMSIIHMHYNRLSKSQPRKCELVIYFILSKVYKTLDIKMNPALNRKKEYIK